MEPTEEIITQESIEAIVDGNFNKLIELTEELRSLQTK